MTSQFFWEKGRRLQELDPKSSLWCHWLGSHPIPEVLPAAFHGRSALESVLAGGSPEGLPSLPEGFARQLVADLDRLSVEASDHNLISKSIADLVSGRARAVVTGQQPGFGGGPLYSLFKIATTVALARLRTTAGSPTVPVFWLGDDDDDWAEAAHPLLWDGAQGKLIASGMSREARMGRQTMIGTLTHAELESETGAVLQPSALSEGSSGELASLYSDATQNNWSLSELSERLLRLVFRGTGLTILRGNDPRLHGHSQEFYQRVETFLPEIQTSTEKQGESLGLEWGVQPVGSNSIRRPLYLAENNFRQPITPGQLPRNSAQFRCGVLLRSLLQDWLLKPAAVVVGPGELSYLSQLVPAYKRLGLARSPLIPRLFGWILPPEVASESVSTYAAPAGINAATAIQLAKGASGSSEKQLVEILTGPLGLPEDRAKELAAKRTRRWVKGVSSLLQNESRRQVAALPKQEPTWVFPQGQRQERRLAWVTCVANWGQPLVDLVLESAERHLQGGQQGQWNEYLLRVPVPPWWLRNEG